MDGRASALVGLGVESEEDPVKVREGICMSSSGIWTVESGSGVVEGCDSTEDSGGSGLGWAEIMGKDVDR